MRGSSLFLKSRRTLPYLAVAAVVFVTAFLAREWIVRPHEFGTLTFPLAMVAPAFYGLAIGALSGSPTPELDRGATRNLVRARGAQLAFFLVVAGIFVGALATSPINGQSILSAERNLLGFTGITLVCAAIVGPKLSWFIPLAWITLPPFYFVNREDDPVGIATFYAQADDQLSSLIFCLIVAGVGLALAVGFETARSPLRVLR